MTQINEHCKDCCCARAWNALGITEYTGKSIAEHIAELKAPRTITRKEFAALVTSSFVKYMHDKQEGSFSRMMEECLATLGITVEGE